MKLSQVTGRSNRILVFTFPKLSTLAEKKEQLQLLSNHAFFIFLNKWFLKQSPPPPAIKFFFCLNKQKSEAMKSQLSLALANFWKIHFSAGRNCKNCAGSQKSLRIPQFLGKSTWVKLNGFVLEKPHVADFLDLSPFAHNMARKNACQLKTRF